MVIDYLKSNQPYRFLGKSIRNLFCPVYYDINFRKTINIEVSSACDLECVFCVYRRGYRKKETLKTDDFRKVATSAINLGYVNLDLTPPSGELFLNKNAVAIIRTAKECGFKHIGTYTNGISLHNHNVEELLRSGINVIIISFPGFGGKYYKEICQADKFDEFEKSMTLLMETHRKSNSDVIIIFEPRTYLSFGQIIESDFYCKFISRFVGNKIFMREPVRVFDSWCGEITEGDLVKGMKVDISAIKSVYPFKNVYPCVRIFMTGVLVNGDVRLCNCRYDKTIGTEKDSLFVGNIYNYGNLEELIREHDEEVQKVRSQFRNGRLPALCKRCSFYRPVRYS